jgi:serine O-acetyltransferase
VGVLLNQQSAFDTILFALAIGGGIVGFATVAWLLVVLPSAVVCAKKARHRGSWWALYVLGLHELLRPLHRQLRQAPGVRYKLSRFLSLVYQCLTILFGAEIPLTTQIGKGLFLPHTAGVILAGLVKVGDNCVICPGVVLGTDGRGHPPTIGHNVYIGANVVIIGPVTVGHSATIGAGTILTRDIPPLALAVGNPGTVVKENYRRTYHNYANEA